MKHFNEVPALSWNTASTITAAMTVGLVVLNIGIGGVIWRCLLLDNGVSVFWRQVLVIFSIAQLGKYLPGNVGQHVGRVFMAKEIDIPITITLCTMMVEMLWGVGIGGGLAIAALIEFVDGDKLGLQFSPLQLGLGTFILLFMPWLGIGFLNKYLPKLAKRLSGGGVMATPKLLTAVFVAVLFLLCFVIMGLILKLQAQWFFGVTKGNMFELTCLFSVAWLAGYLLPGAPAGLGVREAVMVLLLSPVLGAGTAVGLGITLRVTTTVGDAVAFMLGVTVRKLNARLFISTLS
ncbi:MAG: hypothetical protein NTV66_07545 [Methylococcales bacterium]|nr:hypothetical protein [Methylococcales bacterium]